MFQKLKIVCLLLVTIKSFSQSKYTISGYVKDKKNGEDIIGAIITVSELAGTGTSTNAYGFYSFTIPTGTYELKISTLGFQTYSQKIELDKNITLDIKLEETSTQLEEVIISTEREDKNVRETQMGVQQLEMKEINKIPVLLGEKDILKTMTLLPGIKSAGEGNSGFNVRGGATDQNLILLDEAPVYNASHLLGLFSTFNSDAIKDAQIYKGAMPAQFGGRLSSVMDIKMKEGNNQKFGFNGGIGLISSRLTVEGPLKKDKGSFLLSGRRTYLDQFLKLSPDFKDNTLYFYDINMKMNYKINDKNKVFLSGYFGKDNIGFGKAFGIDWGNATLTARWNHIINARWFSNSSFIFSNFNYSFKFQSGDDEVRITSKIQDLNFKQEFSYFINPKNSIKMGVNVIHHTIKPGELFTNEGSSFRPFKIEDRYSLESAVYTTHEWKPTEKLSVNYGLRLTSFLAMGSGTFFSYDKDGELTNSKKYKSGEVVQSYFNPEPRISANYTLSEHKSIKASYGRTVQNLHVINNAAADQPTDVWLSSSKNIKPGMADQFSVGYFQNFAENKYEFSAETYYKSMQNQLDYRNGTVVNGNEFLEGDILSGIGRAYGIELLMKKKKGRFTGWVGYTLSKSERKIEGINNNNWYSTRQDRTHDISIVAMYDLSKRWSISASWVYNTGNAVTLPTGKYGIDGRTQLVYSERNGYRMPDFHRLDLGATYTGKQFKRFQSSWNFSIYNAYARENPYMIEFKEDPNDASKTQAIQTSLFRIIPSVTYNFKF
ncbi:MAG: TonB-dependent receptor [Cytophagales bacterium]|nr:MAG: TonB-dependent receptor [Cytophagales bacterium]